MFIIGTVSSSDKSVPNAPTIGTATNVGSGRAFNNGRSDVTFTAPAYTGRLPITSYTVTSSPGGFTGTGAASPISVTGLQSNTAYTFTVTGTNSVGTSAASAASNSITATTVPQAPTIGTATDGGTGTTVSVAFTGNATGGSAITGYTATSSPGGFTGTGASSPITVSGLTAGTAYTFTVTATNANGTSTASAASNSVTPATPTSFENIASFTPTTGTSITFSSIPQTYKSLQIRVFAGTQQTTNDTLRMRLNGVTTSSYWAHNIYGTGASAAAEGFGVAQTSIYPIVFLPASDSNAFGGAIIDIIDYSSTSKNKTVRYFSGHDTNNTFGGRVYLGSGLILSTSAVSSITFFTENSSNFRTGTTIALYGIKG